MERLIAVSLYHRGHFSRGQNRHRFGYEAYYWGAQVMPKEGQGGSRDTHDATDSSEIDKVTWRMTNPNMDWLFRARKDVDTELSAKLLGRIVIGVVPDEISSVNLEELFRRVPLNTNPQRAA